MPVPTHPDDDPAATLDALTWAQAALAATLHDAATTPLAEVLKTNPHRTAVLDAAGLLHDGTLRHTDVADVTEQATYDLVWLPAPFLPEPTLTQALPRLIDALKPGAWIVAGTNATAHGLHHAQQFPAVPGGPVLVAAQREN
ncbi:hypothetical protein JNUCC0626_09410 [Lentzea sp. JNUCC 0626]|uniref:hypothetical protein n=1 Tax=Lentzea sp. JNUCC 0626 TaxID=3367513 RepID=UPI0037498D62